MQACMQALEVAGRGNDLGKSCPMTPSLSSFTWGYANMTPALAGTEPHKADKVKEVAGKYVG